MMAFSSAVTRWVSVLVRRRFTVRRFLRPVRRAIDHFFRLMADLALRIALMALVKSLAKVLVVFLGDLRVLRDLRRRFLDRAMVRYLLG